MWKIYLEGLKQLRVIGILAFVIFIIEAIVVGLSYGFSETTYYYSISYTSSTPEIVSFMSAHPALILTFVLLAPLMTLYLFYFLNKRNSSDFYHSIPVSRYRLFLSFFWAIITWIIGIIVVSSAASYITSLFFKSEYVLNTASIFSFSFNCFAASLMITAAITIAMCLTGTMLTNIIVSGIIIFIPRIFLTFITGILANELPMLIQGNFIPIIDPSYSVAFGTVYSFIFGYQSVSSPLTSYDSGIYTLIVGCVYMIIALFLFRTRKSETATSAAPNNLIQMAYRIILSMTICLIPVYLIFSIITGNEPLSKDMLLIISVGYIAAILVAFIYEIISTKKWKNLLKVFPGLGITALLNVLFILGMTGMYNAILNDTPKTEDIQYINILQPSSNYYYSSWEENNYFSRLLEDFSSTDKEIHKIISDSLKSNIDLYKNSVNEYNLLPSQGYVSLNVSINTGFISKKRLIYVKEGDYNKIISLLGENENFKEMVTTLPELGKNTNVHLMEWSTTPSGMLSKDSLEKIYNTMREELKTLDFATLSPILSVLTSNLGDDPSQSTNTLIVETAIGSDTYTTYLPLSSVLSETCDEYFRQIQYNNGNELETAINKILNKKEKDEYDISITTYDFNNPLADEKYNYYYLYWYEDTSHNLNSEIFPEFQEWLTIFLNNKENEIKIAEPHGKITLNYFDTQKGEYEYYFFYVSFNDFSQMEAFEDFLLLLENKEGL